MKGVYTAAAGAIMMILLLLSSGCAELPPEETDVWSALTGATPAPAKTPSPVPTPTYVVPATPYPTPTREELTSPIYRSPPAQAAANDTYLEIYQQKRKYNCSEMEAFSYNLTSPPLFIDFTVTPAQITRSITTTSSYGTKAEKTLTVTHLNDMSWFEVTVRDRDTGRVIAREGFGRTYDSAAKKTLTVRTGGNYLIEMTGCLVTVDLHMRVRAIPQV